MRYVQMQLIYDITIMCIVIIKYDVILWHHKYAIYEYI